MVSFAYIMCLVLYKITQDCCLDIDAVKDASIGQGLPASKQALPNQHHAACVACCCAALSAWHALRAMLRAMHSVLLRCSKRIWQGVLRHPCLLCAFFVAFS